jgi:hypothetical protein
MSVMIRIAAAAGGLLTVFLGAGCATHATGVSRAAQGCTARIERRVTLRRTSAVCGQQRTADQVSAAGSCRVQASGQGRSELASARLGGQARPKRAAGASTSNRTLAIATLCTWLFTASLGGYMLHTWITRGGLNRQRASGDRFPRTVIFAHVSLASTGLMLWALYLVTGWTALAWTAVGLLTVVAGLGISTVTLFTPYPARATPAGADPLADPAPDSAADQGDPDKTSDEVLARALTDDVLVSKLVDDMLATLLAEPSQPARKPQWHVTAIIPVIHGAGAITTILLAVVTAASAR